jgi:phosphatidate cytidylyltransferase
MVPEGEERSGKFEDLFDDLDKFFAQSNPGAGRRGSGARGTEEERAGSTRPDSNEPLDAGTSEPAEDLLPPGWEPDIEGLDLGAGRDSEDNSRSDASRGQEPEEQEYPGGEAPDKPGEMTGEDWARLRDTLGGGDGVDERDDTVEGSGAETGAETGAEIKKDLLSYGGGEDLGDAVAMDTEPPAEEGHELSLEDLKKAPPEYRDLPQSEEEEVGADTGESFGREEGRQTGADEWSVSEAAAPEEPSWDEPDMADVEAAADNLAASMGEAPRPGQVEEELLADIEEPEGPRTVRVGGAEPLTGPTWEEPTSHPLMAEPGGPPEPGRNLPAAVLTAAALAAVALLTLAVARAAFAVVAGAVVLLGQAELYATMQRKGHQPATALGLVIGGFTLAGAYLKGEQAMAFFVVLGLLLAFLWYMAAAPKAREGAIANIASTMLGVLYVPFLAGYILIILAQARSGRPLMLAVLGLTFVYDIAAFLFGSFWGSRALAPTISPKKSWEGLFGATVVTFALAVAILPSIEPLNLVKSVGLAIVVAVFAPLGDLAESVIKRDLGVKDMGSVLPGHGGVLDRIDSVLFVAPAAFYFLRLIF